MVEAKAAAEMALAWAAVFEDDLAQLAKAKAHNPCDQSKSRCRQTR